MQTTTQPTNVHDYLTHPSPLRSEEGLCVEVARHNRIYYAMVFLRTPEEARELWAAIAAYAAMPGVSYRHSRALCDVLRARMADAGL